MRIGRAVTPQGLVSYGIIANDVFQPLDGSPFEQSAHELRPASEPASLASVRLLAPCQPGKIIGVGRNYIAHAAEHGAEVPSEPLIFLKAPSAVIGPDAPIVLTALSQQVEHEAELVVVIGRRSRNLTLHDALDGVLGYTCGNDVTARDLQRRDGQWSRAKSFDTFCPLGPWIETELDPSNQRVRCVVNGAVRQDGTTDQMVFDITTLLVYVTAVMTLDPGDVVMTGTPSGVSPLKEGDWVEVSVSGVGALRNQVRAP